MASSTSRTLLILSVPVFLVCLRWFIKKLFTRVGDLVEDRPEKLFSSDSSSILYHMNLKGVGNTVEETDAEMKDIKLQASADSQKNGHKVQKNGIKENGSISLQNGEDSLQLANKLQFLAIAALPSKCGSHTFAKDKVTKLEKFMTTNGIKKSVASNGIEKSVNGSFNNFSNTNGHSIPANDVMSLHLNGGGKDCVDSNGTSNGHSIETEHVVTDFLPDVKGATGGSVLETEVVYKNGNCSENEEAVPNSIPEVEGATGGTVEPQTEDLVQNSEQSLLNWDSTGIVSYEDSTNMPVGAICNELYPLHNGHMENVISCLPDEPLPNCVMNGPEPLAEGAYCEEEEDEDFVPEAVAAPLMVYEFSILPRDCGRLIGKGGRHVKALNYDTGSNIIIKQHPFEPEQRLCSITGTESQINHALEMIRLRFPTKDYDLSLKQTNVYPGPFASLTQSLSLALPERVTVDVCISSSICPGQFFVQQPSHSTFHRLHTLSYNLQALYSASGPPVVPEPSIGDICVAPVWLTEQGQTGWFRCEVVDLVEAKNLCTIKFLDFGGFSPISTISLRQIHASFLNLPFQANECCLANIEPVGGEWTFASKTFFDELTAKFHLQCVVVGYKTTAINTRVPAVYLMRKHRSLPTININHEMVKNGYAVHSPSFPVIQPEPME